MKNFKRLCAVFAAVFVLSLGFVSCSDPTNDTTPVPPPVLPGTISIIPAGNVAVGTLLTAVYSENENGLTYQWNKDGTAIPEAVNKTYTPQSGGSYTVTVNKAGYTGIPSAAVSVPAPVLSSLGSLAGDLAAITGDSAAVPVVVKLAGIRISTAASAPAESTGWGDIYDILDAAEKYVVLDLSECSFTDNAVTGNFDPAGNDMNIMKDSEHIKGLIFPEGVTSIGGAAFYECTGLTSVTIPGNVTSIGGNAFWCCTGLTSVTIPGSVTSIGDNAFYGCTGLTSVTIPEDVTSIGVGAFNGCTGLVNVTFGGTNTEIDNYSFPYSASGGSDTLKKLYATGGAGTYTRTEGADDWEKQQ